MIALLVVLINTNAITLFIRLLLIRPNFEQKRRWPFFPGTVFCVFSNLGKTLDQN